VVSLPRRTSTTTTTTTTTTRLKVKHAWIFYLSDAHNFMPFDAALEGTEYMVVVLLWFSNAYLELQFNIL